MTETTQLAIAILVPLALAIAYLSGSIRAYDHAIEWYENAAKFESMFPRTQANLEAIRAERAAQ